MMLLLCYMILDFVTSYGNDIVPKSVQFLILRLQNTFELPHDKTNKMACVPAKTQISLGICPV